MTLPGDAPRAVRRPDVERRLIDAVIRLSEDGTSFSAIGIAQLVREAGLGRATFYLYFADRSQFVLRLADYVNERLAPTVSTLWSAAFDDRAVLEQATTDFLSIFRANYPIVAAVVEAAAGDSMVSARTDADMQRFVTRSAQAVADAQRRGVVRADLAPYEAAATLIWMFERTCYQFAKDDDAQRRTRLAATLASITWYALHP